MWVCVSVAIRSCVIDAVHTITLDHYTCSTTYQCALLTEGSVLVDDSGSLEPSPVDVEQSPAVVWRRGGEVV